MLVLMLSVRCFVIVNRVKKVQAAGKSTRATGFVFPLGLK